MIGFYAESYVSGIYIITCLANGCIYVGQAVDFEDRWYTHRYDLDSNWHCNIHLQRAWNKYGETSFRFDRFLLCPPDKLILFMYEGQVMEDLQDGGIELFNMNPAGPTALGYKHTEENRRKNKERQQNLHMPTEARAARDREICDRYIGGDSFKRIADSMDMNVCNIYYIVLDAGVPIRSKEEGMAISTQKYRDEHAEQNRCICEMYQNGSSMQDVANHFDLHVGTVSYILRDENCYVRPIRLYTDEEERTICQRYMGGESATAIAASLDTSTVTIIGVIKRAGGTIRKLVESSALRWEKDRLFNLSQREKICERYDLGQSAEIIASDMGCNPATIRKVIRQSGRHYRTYRETIEMRKKNKLATKNANAHSHV